LNILESALQNSNKDNKVKYGLSEKRRRKGIKSMGQIPWLKRKRYLLLRSFIAQFSDFMVLILLASTLISAFMGELTEAITIVSIVILNALMGFVQEYRTEKTLEAFKKPGGAVAKVVRDGKTVEIPAEKVVPGDLCGA